MPNNNFQNVGEDEETSKYVRNLMRSVFQVEEAAAQIKGKYTTGAPKSSSITSGDVMSSLLSSIPSKKPDTSITSNRPVLKTSNLSKQEKMVL